MTPFSSALLLLASASASFVGVGVGVRVSAGPGMVSLPGFNGVGVGVQVSAGPGVLAAPYRPVKSDLVTNGSSSTSGNPGHKFQDRIAARTDGGSILNLGIGGTTGAQIRDRLLSQTPEIKARWQTIQQPGNGATDISGFTAGHGYLLDCIAGIGHTNYMAMPKFNDGGMGWGSFEGTCTEYLRHLHRQLDQLKVLNLPAIFREIPGLSGQDLIDQQNNTIPSSMLLDASHANQTGLNYVGDEFVRWIDGFNLSGNGLPWFPSFHPLYATADSGRIPGGLLGTLPYAYAGNINTVTVGGGIPGVINVARVGSDIRLTNASAGPLPLARYKVPIVLTNSAQTRTDYIYLFPSSATTKPSTISLDGSTWLTIFDTFLPTQANQFTAAIDITLNAADDGRDLYLALTQSNGLTIRRVSTNNTWRFSMRTTGSGSNSVFTINTPSGSAAGGARHRLVFSADALAGTAQVTVDGVAYTASWTPDGTPFNTAPALSSAGSVLFCDNNSGKDGAGAAKALPCTFSQFWIGRTWLAGGAAANSAFFNLDGSAKDLGAAATINGAQPDYLWRGGAGDFAYGYNPGLSGQVFPSLRSLPTTLAFGEAAPAFYGTGAGVRVSAGPGQIGLTGNLTGVGAGVRVSGGPGVFSVNKQLIGVGAGVRVSGGPGYLEFIPAVREWLSVEEARVHLRVDDTVQDAEISDLIAAARSYIADTFGIEPDTRDVTFYYDNFNRVVLPRWPVQQITSVTWIDGGGVEQMLDPALYRAAMRNDVLELVAMPGALLPAVSGPGIVKVDATVGFAAREELPAAVRRAALLLIGWWFGPGRDGAETSESVRMAVSGLMAPYRRWLI